MRAKIQSAFEQLAMPHVAKVRSVVDISVFVYFEKRYIN